MVFDGKNIDGKELPSVRGCGDDRLSPDRPGQDPAQAVGPSGMSGQKGNAEVPVLIDGQDGGIRELVAHMRGDAADGNPGRCKKDQSIRLRKPPVRALREPGALFISRHMGTAPCPQDVRLRQLRGKPLRRPVHQGKAPLCAGHHDDPHGFLLTRACFSQAFFEKMSMPV